MRLSLVLALVAALTVSVYASDAEAEGPLSFRLQT